MLTLYGTTTSPYVRRVRVVATELGLPHELVNTASPDGQSRLHAVTPIWKVPVAELNGRVVLDSRVIVDELMRRYGPGPLRPHDDALEASNLLTVIDGALDSLINAFYLAKDGLGRDSASYLERQHRRARSALEWIEARLGGPELGGELGLLGIALVCALDWMQFREAYSVADHPSLAAFLASHADRPSFVATHPRV